MTNLKRLLVVFVAILALVVLIWNAVLASAKQVMTVEELAMLTDGKDAIRVVGRVRKGSIEYNTKSELKLSFDIQNPGTEMDVKDTHIRVVYYGAMPDTFNEGRDVILEGDYLEGELRADTLMTQCPSKYKPAEYSDEGSK